MKRTEKKIKREKSPASVMRYSLLVDVYEKLEATPKRLEKVAHIAKFLEETPLDELEMVILLLQGTVFPTLEEKKTRVAEKLVARAIMLATGRQDVEETWKKTGDLGDTAYELVKTKMQQTLFTQRLGVAKVFSNIKKLAELEGEGSTDTKQQYMAELLTNAEPKEARYIVRTLLGDMRIGAGEGLLRDALVWAYYPKIVYITLECSTCHALQPVIPECAFCKGELAPIIIEGKKVFPVSDATQVLPLAEIEILIPKNEKIARELYNGFINEVQEALDVYNDLPLLAKRAKTRTVKLMLEAGLVPGKPVKAMLFQKVKSIADAFLTVGKPAAHEFKYDGFRLQVHRNGDIVRLFTRSMEDVTAQFPDIVDIAQKYINSHDYIIDAEVVGFEKGRFTPFQMISQRIQRKYDVHMMEKEVPVLLIPFDVLELNGKNALLLPFSERRKLLSSVVAPKENAIGLAQQLITENEDEAAEFYELALAKGVEGMMVKNLTAPYKPGARVGYGVKIKPTMETLDLAIVGAEWGEGKRVQWLSSFTIACRNEGGEFLETGKVGTGFKEKGAEGVTFAELTEQLRPHILKEAGKEVTIKPFVVLEIAFEEIQQSPSYNSGFALRFPRFVRLRKDKTPEECSSLALVQQLYDEQNR